MAKSLRWAVGVVLAAAMVTAAAAEPAWHGNLFLALGDVWRARAPVTVTNTGQSELLGAAVDLKVGAGAGELALTGARARDLRVCDDDGIEMLFDLRGPDGVRLTDGAVPAGSTLTVPAAVKPGQTQRLWVYWDNPSTYLVPDYLKSASGPRNGGFEAGSGGVPDGWQFDGGDGERRMEWVGESPHGGRRCVKTVVAAGAAPSWIAARQRELAVIPGARYKLTCWVKAANVVGRAGWYVHVATPDNPMKVGPLASAGEGTYDWRPLTIEFTAPPDAVSMAHGTVLYGTGTAWFDDVAIECLDPLKQDTRTAVGQPERLTLTRVAGVAQFGEGKYELSAPVRVINLGEAAVGVLVQADVYRFLVALKRGFNPNSLRLVSPAGAVVPIGRSAGNLLFRADLPARSETVFRLFASRDPALSAGPEMKYEDLLTSPANLAVNPSFEEGDTQPTGWPGGTEGGDIGATVRRVEGGLFGTQAGMIRVPAAAKANWTGWRQPISVEPGASYYFGCYLKLDGVDGKVRLHAHMLDAEHRHTGIRFWSAGPDLTGSTDWQRLSSGVAMSGDARIFELHLTMNSHGTVYHDGVVFMRSVVGNLGDLAEGGAPAELAVWTENPVVKVFRDSIPGERPERVELAAGRNEKECWQLCLRTARAGKVTVAASPLSAGGATIAPPVIERVGYVPCLQPAGYYQSKAESWQRQVIHVTGGGRTDGWLGWWPDYLAPSDGGFDLAAGQTQPVWLTYTVPKGAAPGEYQGTVTVTGAGRTERLPIRLTVWRATLPDRPTLQVIYDLRNGRDHAQLRTPEDYRKWWKFMAERRVSTDHVLPDPGIKLVDGQVVMNFTAYDQMATVLYDELQMSAGYFPRYFYALGWGFPPRDFLGLKYPSDEYRAAYQSAVKQFWAHLKEKGWADRLSLYISDEPHYYSSPDVVKWLGDVIDLIRQAAPDIPVYSSTWGHEPRWDGRLNHWGVAQYGRFPVDELKARQKAGDKIWFTTDGQMEISTPYNACERLLPYYCFAYDVSGYEFWGISWFTYDPYQFGWHAFIHQSSEPGQSYWTRYPHGDGYLAYPGQPFGVDGPISTIRLEQAREGIEDYELLLALRDQAAGKPADRQRIHGLLDQVRALVPIPNAAGYRGTDILPDPDGLIALRRRVGDELDKLLR